jgi:hypothetical protein
MLLLLVVRVMTLLLLLLQVLVTTGSNCGKPRGHNQALTNQTTFKDKQGSQKYA